MAGFLTATVVVTLLGLAAAAWFFVTTALGPATAPCNRPWAIPTGDLTPQAARGMQRDHTDCPQQCQARRLALDVLIALGQIQPDQRIQDRE